MTLSAGRTNWFLDVGNTLNMMFPLASFEKEWLSRFGLSSISSLDDVLCVADSLDTALEAENSTYTLFLAELEALATFNGLDGHQFDFHRKRQVLIYEQLIWQKMLNDINRDITLHQHCAIDGRSDSALLYQGRVAMYQQLLELLDALGQGDPVVFKHAVDKLADEITFKKSSLARQRTLLDEYTNGTLSADALTLREQLSSFIAPEKAATTSSEGSCIMLSLLDGARKGGGCHDALFSGKYLSQHIPELAQHIGSEVLPLNFENVLDQNTTQYSDRRLHPESLLSCHLKLWFHNHSTDNMNTLLHHRMNRSRDKTYLLDYCLSQVSLSSGSHRIVITDENERVLDNLAESISLYKKTNLLSPHVECILLKLELSPVALRCYFVSPAISASPSVDDRSHHGGLSEENMMGANLEPEKKTSHNTAKQRKQYRGLHFLRSSIPRQQRMITPYEDSASGSIHCDEHLVSPIHNRERPSSIKFSLSQTQVFVDTINHGQANSDESTSIEQGRSSSLAQIKK